LLILSGCQQGPQRVAAPSWDPPALAERIMSQFDKNGDAKLDAAELKAAPGLAAGARFIDQDKDGALATTEIEARFQHFRDMKLGLRSQSYRLTYKGRPVPDAEVVFSPESYLEGVIEPARGITDPGGMVTPQTEGQKLPGVRVGYYRVRVTSSRAKIPARYSSPTTPLGADVSLGEDATSYGVSELRLVD
jgi:hypothetical protein